MVEVQVVKKYDDIELGRKVQLKERIETTPERAKKLAGMGLVSIIRVNKLTKEEYERITGRKKR